MSCQPAHVVSPGSLMCTISRLREVMTSDCWSGDGAIECTRRISDPGATFSDDPVGAGAASFSGDAPFDGVGLADCAAMAVVAFAPVGGVQPGTGRKSGIDLARKTSNVSRVFSLVGGSGMSVVVATSMLGVVVGRLF